MLLHMVTNGYMSHAGIPGQGYAMVYEPIFRALESNKALLQLYASKNNSAALKDCVNGADTVVDLWGAIEPVYDLTVSLVTDKNASYYTNFYAKEAMLPFFDMVRDAAAAYVANNGVIASRSPEQHTPGGIAPGP